MRAGVRAGRPPRDGDRVDDDGQDAGQAELLGEYPDAEGADELHDDRARHILDPCRCLRSIAARRRKPAIMLPITRERTPARRRRLKLTGCRRRADGERDRSAARVASFNRLSPSRIFRSRCGMPDLPQHRGRGGRIRRRDDRAERDGGRPRHRRHQPVRRRHATADGGDADRDDDERRSTEPSCAADRAAMCRTPRRAAPARRTAPAPGRARASIRAPRENARAAPPRARNVGYGDA